MKTGSFVRCSEVSHMVTLALQVYSKISLLQMRTPLFRVDPQWVRRAKSNRQTQRQSTDGRGRLVSVVRGDR